jgi:hypothetical protein
MRAQHRLIIVAFALCAACSSSADLRPIATIEQIMETTVEPVSNAIFDAAVWENGVRVGGPRTTDDWKALEANAMMLAETGNLLLMPGRAKGDAGWVTRTEDMKVAAMEAVTAAQARNIDAMFIAGGHIYQACTGCHLQYISQTAVPFAGSGR